MQSELLVMKPSNGQAIAKAAFFGGSLHPLLPVDHNPSSLRFLAALAVTLTACVFGHLEKDIYPSRDICPS